MSWRQRLENTQNHAPEELGMTDVAHSDVGEAMKYIAKLEAALEEIIKETNLPLQWDYRQRIQKIAKQMLGRKEG